MTTTPQAALPPPKLDRRTVAQNIIRHRERLGLSRRELADDMGCSESALSSWERGRATIGGDMLNAAALCLGCRVDTLLGLPLRPAPPLSGRRS